MKPPAFFRHLALLPRKLLVGLAVAMLLLLGLGVFAFYNVRHQAQAADMVSHTYEVVSGLQSIFSSVQDAESSQRAFTVSGNETYLEPYNRALAVLPKQLTGLANLISDNPLQIARLGKLRTDIATRLDVIHTRITERRELGVKALEATVLNGAGVHMMAVVREDVDTMIDAEKLLLKQRREILARARVRSELFQTLAGLSSLALLATVFVGLAKLMDRANRAEQATEASNRQLRDANNELRAFSYSVAHDLRAPLRAINGFAQVINEDCAGQLNEEGRKSLDRIVANSSKMAVLIDDLLSLSRVSMQALHKEKVEMNDLVRAAFQELLEAQDGRVIDCDIALLPPATGDPSLLRQVWLNLIGNALKFTRGQSRARIEIGGNVAGPEFATYFIRDNGAGFDMKYADKLFGAFQRLHRPTDFEGTGIGLALVQRIVLRHGGTIWAEGEENHGARFAFTLPEWNGG